MVMGHFQSRLTGNTVKLTEFNSYSLFIKGKWQKLKSVKRLHLLMAMIAYGFTQRLHTNSRG